MSQTLSSLARMTLRQLRQVASELGVTLYSRKTKDELVSAIGERQADLSSLEQEHAPNRQTDDTRVVFLPRDPQWAYVFWEISERDRQQAFKAGASQLCLRVADVTGMSNGASHPHTLQEVPVGNYVADVVSADQVLYEIQTSGFSGLRPKLEYLLQQHHVVLVHPIAAIRYIVKQQPEQPDTRRRSPKRGGLIDLLDVLVSIPELLNHPRFELEVVLISEEELRVPAVGGSWRRKGWRVARRKLLEVLEAQRISSMEDLWRLVPGPLPERFTTRELALAMAQPRWAAQKLAYCLRESGAIELVGKAGNALEYRRC